MNKRVPRSRRCPHGYDKYVCVTCVEATELAVDRLYRRKPNWPADTRSEAVDTIEAQAARIKVLRKALADAIDCVVDWAHYTEPYYRSKHDLDGDIKRLRAALEASNDPAA